MIGASNQPSQKGAWQKVAHAPFFLLLLVRLKSHSAERPRLVATAAGHGMDPYQAGLMPLFLGYHVFVHIIEIYFVC